VVKALHIHCIIMTYSYISLNDSDNKHTDARYYPAYSSKIST